MTSEKTVIRTVIDVQLKAEFEAAAKSNDRVLSQVLRDLIREYIWRFSQGEAWEPGQETKSANRQSRSTACSST